MKKVILIVFIASCFGCSKKSDPKPNNDTWITGKWKITAVYNADYADKQNIDVAFYPDVLTFANDNTVFSYGSKTTFIYSLSDMSINESGVIFKINQTAKDSMTLTHYGSSPVFEILKRQ